MLRRVGGGADDFWGFQLLVVPLVLAVVASIQWTWGQRSLLVGAAAIQAVALFGPGGFYGATLDSRPGLAPLESSAREVARVPDEVMHAIDRRLREDAQILLAASGQFLDQAHLHETDARLGLGLGDRMHSVASTPKPAADVQFVAVTDPYVFGSFDVEGLESALANDGFVVIRTWPVPDGELRLWER